MPVAKSSRPTNSSFLYPFLLLWSQDYLNATQQFSTSSQSNYEAFMETFPFYANLTERCTLKIFGLYLDSSSSLQNTDYFTSFLFL